MVLFPNGAVGRLLFLLILVTTISYLVLNIVSFAGDYWINYSADNVRFGLWRVCDTSAPGLCNYWVNQFASINTANVFNNEKPSFIRTAQALEIISLVFYIEAAAFIIVGLLDLKGFSFEKAFIVAIALLFICIVFLSATLGVMSVQGRSNRLFADLNWSWWVGLAGLIVTIICWITLIVFFLYVQSTSSSPTPSSSDNPKKIPRDFPIITEPWNVYNSPPPMMLPENPMMIPENPMMFYNQADFFMDYNPMPEPAMFYPDEYYVGESPSPIITELAREYLTRMTDAQYGRQLLEPYEPFFDDRYFFNGYM